MTQPERTVPLDVLPSEVERWFVGRTVSEVERSLIVHSLARFNWNRTRAARGLGISLRTMRNKIREYSRQPIGPIACDLTQQAGPDVDHHTS